MNEDQLELDQNMDHTPFRGLIIVFFLSGMCGLIYEIAWMRRLGLSLGTSHLAIVTVLAVYMTGLALGYVWASSHTHIQKKCIGFYASLEIMIGMYGCASPYLLDLADQIQQILDQTLLPIQSFFVSSFIVPCLLAFGFLLIPTVAMGATLPIIIQGTAVGPGRIGRPVALFYGTNTAGAMLGTVLGGLVLVPILGISLTLISAGCCNILLGSLVWLLYHKTEQRSASQPEERTNLPLPFTEEKTRVTEVRLSKGVVMGVMLGYSLAGLASLTCQVTWSRGLILSFGSSIYAFSLVLITFLGGVALGSLLFPVFFRKKRLDLVHCSYLHIGISLGISFSIMLIGILPLLFLYLFRIVHGSFPLLIAGEFLLAMATLFVPTLLMGLLFPFFCELLTRTKAEVGSITGKLGAYNTIGAVAGIFLSGLLFIPWLGSENTLRLSSSIYLGLGLLWFLLSRKQHKPGLTDRNVSILIGLAIVFLVCVPNWDPTVLSQGVFQYAPQIEGTKLPHLDVLYCRDGWTAQVAVTEQNDIRGLRINGKVDGSDGRDMKTQILLAGLPALLAPSRKHVFILGLGTGVTAQAMLEFNPDQVICCEIEQRVLEAAHFFSHINESIFSDPRLQIIIDDARHRLRNHEGHFDIIINEPSNPWIRGIANLFSIEFFSLCRQKLSDHGIICQWLHLYGMSELDTRIALNSFFHVFDTVSIWEGSMGDILLIGMKQPIRKDITTIEQEFIEHATLFQQAGLQDFEQFLQGHVARGKSIDHWVSQTTLNTDDRPVLEFTAPFNLYQDISADIIGRLILMGYRDLPPIPQHIPLKQTAQNLLYLRSMKLLSAGFRTEAVELLDDSLQFHPENRNIIYSLVIYLMNMGELERAESILLGQEQLDNDALLQLAYARVLHGMGRRQEAAQACMRATELGPAYLPTKIFCSTLEYDQTGVVNHPFDQHDELRK
ncbi:fused MFS/spermidine synthase [bacterium]|nr:fused MFS/spermidine synthase [bacterium]